MLTSYGDADIFIAKYDSVGNVIWVEKAGGLLEDVGNSIASDINNNIYITGYFDGNANFGDTSLTSDHSAIFLAKYDETGKCIWVKQPGGGVTSYTNYVASDSEGNMYIAADFGGNAIFEDTVFTSEYLNNIFIAKYDSKGNYKWILTAGGEESDIGGTVICDSMRNVYITGVSQGGITFGDTILTGWKNFIVKYDSIGNFIWANQYEVAVSSVTLDNKNNIYVTGYFSQNTYLGDIALTSYGKTDILIAKLAETAIQANADKYKNNQALKLYPNPNNGIVYFEVKIPYPDGLSMEFINITGELIYKKEYKSIAFPIIDQIDLSQYPKGIYFVRFRSKNHIQVGKLILQ